MSTAHEEIQKLKFTGAVDADGHILEDAGLWDRYIEAKYKDRAVRVSRDSKGLEYLEVAGKPSKIFHSGRLGGLSAMGVTRDDKFHSRPTYGGSAPFGAMDAKERLARIDAEGLAAAFLYPTMSLLWETETEDAELAQACTRAYNRYIVDFCSESHGRLIPIAHLSARRSLRQPLRRARARGQSRMQRRMGRAIRDDSQTACASRITTCCSPRHRNSTFRSESIHRWNQSGRCPDATTTRNISAVSSTSLT